MIVLSRPDIELQLVAPDGPPRSRLTFDTVSDRELVARASAGERGAFEALLRRHYDGIHRIAWRLTGSASDAEDIAQDVCCVLIEKLGGFK
jgi:hypothetical protein